MRSRHTPTAGAKIRLARSATHPGLHDASGQTLGAQVIDVDGCETFVVDAGAGPPIVLLHGFADTADGWRRVVPALLPQHRVVAIDVPPFGRSGDPAESDGRTLIDFYTDFFPELFETLEIECATIMGHSLGGAIALSLALEQPHLAERLLLVAPAGLGNKAPWWWHAIAGRPINWSALLRLPNPVASQTIRTAMKGFLEERLMYDRRGLDEVVEHFVDLHGGRRELEALLAVGRALIPGYTGDLLNRSRRLATPVSVVWGRHDRLAPVEHAAAFAAAVPHAHVHLLESCGHYPQIECPTRVIEVLEGTLEHGGAAQRPARARAVRRRRRLLRKPAVI
jgi:pimeloyl-ACP methyl ester carboxylesterase